MTDDDLKKQQEVEFYAAGVTTWYNTRLEHDKSLLALSAGGIGLLITLLTTIGVSSAEGLVLHLLAMFSFLLCLGAILIIFKKNSKHIEDVLKTGTQPFDDPLLAKLDNIAIAAFAAGIIFSSVIGVSAAINSYSNKEKAMANENKDKTGFSVNGVSNLKPAGENKSFNGVNTLKPSTPQVPTSSTPGAAQGTAPVTNQNNDKKQ
jgi:hypothetical protein